MIMRHICYDTNMNKFLEKISIEIVLLILLSILIASYTFMLPFVKDMYIPHTLLRELSQSFIHGKLFLANPSLGIGDIALFENKFYLFYGPFPSLFLAPLVFLIPSINQHFVLLPFFIGAFYCFLKIFFRVTNSWKKSLYLVFGFFFGTSVWFLASINITAYVVQLMAIFLLIISLYFYINKKSLLLSGLIFSFMVATRLMLILTLVFFVVDILRSNTSHRKKLLNILIFTTPLLVVLTGLGFYNFARFHNLLDSGYNYNISDNRNIMFVSAKAHGFFSLSHIPGNIYYGFLKPLDPIFENVYSHVLKFPYFKADPSGFSIFLSSPFLLYIFYKVKRGRYFIPSIAAIFVVMISVLMYFSSGTWTYGYRYALDYFPFLFIILAYVFKYHFSLTVRLLIIFSIIFNAFFMYSMWGVYPLLPNPI